MKRVMTLAGLLALAAATSVLAQQFNPGLRSVKIEAQDWTKSTAFYTALGMKAGVKRDTTQDMVWEQPSQNSGLVMTNHEYAVRAKMVRGGTYLMIVTPDIVALAARLKAAGFADTPAPRAMGSSVSVMLLHDPDGNQIEVLGPPLAK